MSASVPTKTIPSSSFPGQRISVDPTDIQPSPSVEMMSLVEVPEQSPTIGLVGVELSTIEVLLTLVSSSSSSEKLDYSGDDDVDWDHVHSSPNTSKYSHLAEKEMQVAAPEIELPFGEISTIEGIFSTLIIVSFFSRHCFNLFLNICRGYCYR